MNPQQHREEARHRRLVTRQVAQNRQIYFDDVRRSTVNSAAANPRRLPRNTVGVPQDVQQIDSPAMTLLLKAGIIASMLGMLVQFRQPLSAAVLSLLPFGLIG